MNPFSPSLSGCSILLQTVKGMSRFLFLFCCILILISSLSTAQQNGIAQDSEIITTPAGDRFLRWYGHAGRSYFIQVSDQDEPLRKWNWAPIIEGGADAYIEHLIGGTASKAFVRLKYTSLTPGPNETLDTADFDQDGLSNLSEIDPPLPLLPKDATDPLDPDTDDDGLNDGYERDNGLDPNDPNGDPDYDGRTNTQELADGTNPLASDTDEDGSPDGEEHANGTDPTSSTEFPTKVISIKRSSSGYYMTLGSYTWSYIYGDMSYLENTYNEDRGDTPLQLGDSVSKIATIFPYPSQPPLYSEREDGISRDKFSTAVVTAYALNSHTTDDDGIHVGEATSYPRLWVRTPASETQQIFRFVKFTTLIISPDSPPHYPPHVHSAEMVDIVVLANQILSNALDFTPILAPISHSQQHREEILCSVSLINQREYILSSDDVAIVPKQNEEDTNIRSVAWIDAHTSETVAEPRMPNLKFSIASLPPDLRLRAKLEIDYTRPYVGHQNQDRVQIPANGDFRDVTTQNWEIYDDPDWIAAVNEGFFGGDATLIYQVTKLDGSVVLPSQTFQFRIAGQNPVDARCKTYTQQSPSAPWYSYAIEKHESQAYNPGYYNQFWERNGNNSPINQGINYTFKNGEPLVVRSPGETGVGGAGLAQVTGAGGNKNVPPPRDILWNWQSNVDSFLAILAGKLQIAQNFMNDSTPGSGSNPRPKGQRPQTSFDTGQNVSVPSRLQGQITFGDNQGQRSPEDAIAIKAYNGASAHWCSWRGPTAHVWQFNYGQNNYVEEVSNEIEEAQP